MVPESDTYMWMDPESWPWEKARKLGTLEKALKRECLFGLRGKWEWILKVSSEETEDRGESEKSKSI